MRKLAITLVLALVAVNTYAATRCESDGRGGMCCWDTTRDGPFRPLGC